ncbi:ABC transporter ATP-binding protein [Butyrivibrio sp. CB08]|uniref:ABC transporter ATP-binding protein n=1 Tax=Butyrivibrio sp. CB08 TaxID=2364879 RepID=UPI000EA9C706|nr:ABC transporter ATP-binding protein [Butyrivibrio sp. CB08]RKM56754.1 ABC transporter ATP-binding protein [Butyrivibrio sp. CB08]
MKKSNNLFFLFKAMGPFRICMFLSIVFAAASAIVSIKAYTYVYLIAEEVIGKMGEGALDASLISDYGNSIVFMICGGFGLYGLALLFSHITAFNTAARLKRVLIEHIGALPGGYHDVNPSGSVRKIIEKNTDVTETLIAHQIPNTTMSIVLPIAFVVFMFKYSVFLSVACIIPVIIGFALLMAIMMGNGSDFVRTYQQASKDMSNAAVEYVRGIPVMKTFGQTADSFNRYKTSVDFFCQYVLKFAVSMMNADSSYNTAINSVFYALVPAALIAFNRSEDQLKVICSFIFFASIIPLEVTILKRIMSNSSETIIVDEAMGTLRAVLDEKPMEYAGNKVPEGYDIKFTDVSFRYADNLPYVLKNVSLTMKEGTMTALVGMSGGGKSTIAQLCARLRDAYSGTVTIGDVDIKDISEETLNEILSIVFQESTLLKMSIAENVALYKKNASRNEILRALEAAQCSDIISKLPNGIDTVYGSNGAHLSGGEIQRIAIARAILKDSPIVILDEATAFADAENEYLIRKSFENLLKGKTVIMIAHRLSSIRNADNIYVIDGGAPIEEGTNKELMALRGRYYEMYCEYKKAVSWKLEKEVPIDAKVS